MFVAWPMPGLHFLLGREGFLTLESDVRACSRCGAKRADVPYCVNCIVKINWRDAPSKENVSRDPDDDGGPIGGLEEARFPTHATTSGPSGPVNLSQRTRRSAAMLGDVVQKNTPCPIREVFGLVNPLAKLFVISSRQDSSVVLELAHGGCKIFFRGFSIFL